MNACVSEFAWVFVCLCDGFCVLGGRYHRLDIIINNACQTVRRPPQYYQHLIPTEVGGVAMLPDAARPTVHHHSGEGTVPHVGDAIGSVCIPTGDAPPVAVASQLIMLPGDAVPDPDAFPIGAPCHACMSVNECE